MTAEIEITSIRPIFRTAEDHLDAKGQRVRTRVFGPASPHYYADELGVLRPIEVGRVEDAVSAQAGAIALRSRNIVSVGLRKDGSPEKFIGLRPDFCQALNTQGLEFSLEAIEIDGQAQPIFLSAPHVLDAVTQDMGSVIVQSTHQRTRLLVPTLKPKSDFRLQYRIYTQGLAPFYRADLDEYWFYDDQDKFRFRIVRPQVIDPATGEPVRGQDGFPLQDQVKHALTPNADGSWSYTKRPGKDFNPAILPETCWLDADIVYSTTADGTVGYSNADWTTTRSAATGSSITKGISADVFSMCALISMGTYYIYRSFFIFPVDGFSGSVDSATIGIYGFSTGYESDVSIQLGTQAASLTTDDFDSFSGDLYDYVASWNGAGYNVFDLNAQGIADLESVINSGDFKVCAREYSHDYLNSTPTVQHRNGCYYADYANTDHDPYLEITWGSPPAGIIPVIMHHLKMMRN